MSTSHLVADDQHRNADVDEHGCKASAGFTWSVVRNECIAIFEGTIRLNPVDSFMDKNLSAFVVFKSDIEDAQAEIFMPKEKSSLIFDKVKDNGAGTWKHEDLTLTQWKGMYTLEDGDKRTLYRGMLK